MALLLSKLSSCCTLLNWDVSVCAFGGRGGCMVAYPACSTESASWVLLLLNACRGNTAIHVSVSLHGTNWFIQVHTGSQSFVGADTATLKEIKMHNFRQFFHEGKT